jgi:hypothetical protein
MLKKLFVRAGLAVAFGSVSVSAFALPVDYTTLLSAADFSTTTAAIISIAGIMAVVYVAWKGAKLVLSALRGG